jgi:putative membrane-bound dehydrogenase-like protein
MKEFLAKAPRAQRKRPPVVIAVVFLLFLYLSSSFAFLAPLRETLPVARPGFTVELMVAEPLIESPIAFDWGADGKLWVVEMRDYPLGMDNKGKPGGRIVCLEDTHGDGRYDKSTVFLDNLLFPTGIMTWGKGVLISCAPDILYAEDTDGDGKADKVEVLFTGFGEANPQHRVNGLRWGLDNWVYCANGDFAAVRKFGPPPAPGEGGTGFSSSQAEDLRRLALAGAHVKSRKTGAKWDVRNRDFRIRPDEGILDPQSGQAQFGRDRDDWGNWFGCNNALPMWHYALDDHYLRRNPHVAAPSPRVEAPRSVTYALGVGRNTGTPRNSAGNAWTSGCGITIYRDTLFGPEFTDNWFTCEPVHNLVHREVLQSAGGSFTSRRGADEQTSDFLASTDPMFTPVTLRTGPDGVLWVADMYRKVLEHPHWLPPGWEKTIDVRAGHDRGRIYRVYPADKKPRAWPRLDRLDTAGLVALLDNPNGWLRDKAQQMLVQRRATAAVAALEAKATAGTTVLGRLHALCALDGLRKLKPAVLERALRDSHAGVRRHAVRLSEDSAMHVPEVESALIRRVDDSDAFVRVQLAYTLGAWDSTDCGKALGRLLVRNSSDQYIVAAVLSSLTHKNLATVADAVRTTSDSLPPAVTLGLLQSAVGFGEPRAAAALLRQMVQAHDGHLGAVQFGSLAAWLDSLEQRGTPLREFTRTAEEPLRTELTNLGAVFTAARKAVGDLRAPLAERVLAVRLVGLCTDRRPEDQAALASLLGPRQPEELQVAAIIALGRSGDSDALLKEWRSFTPKLRLRILDVLLQRRDGLNATLDALAGKRALPQDVPLPVRQRLLEHSDKEVRTRAGKVFLDLVDPDRNKVVIAYEAALRRKGDPAQGLRVFGKNCATCHRLGVIGQAIGPDLGMVRDKAPEWFLPALFDPSRAVEAQYLSYTLTTKEGKTFSGILAEEGGNSLTLISPTGERQVILRANLEELFSSGKSLMPDGLEKDLTVQDTADVIAYLTHRHPARKVVPLNKPELVKPEAKGELRLLAGNCEIFGNEIHIEEKQQCLGWWNSLDDRAVWTFELPRPGRYAVWLDWACDDTSAGHAYALEVEGQSLRGRVSSTGSWETYRQEKIGEIRLRAGMSQLIFHAGEKIGKGKYLIDLKGVYLRAADDR